MVAEIDKKTDLKAKTTQNLKIDVRPGDTVKVYQIIKELAKKKKGKGSETKERVQVFEGVVLARKHGNEIGGTITVRKVIAEIGVERIFPVHSPKIQKIEVVKRSKVRRAKLYYLRTAKYKKARLKRDRDKTNLNETEKSLNSKKSIEKLSDKKES